MSFFRNLGQFMLHGARAHARWEIQVSNTILRDRRRMIILAILLLPVLVGGIAFSVPADGVLPELLGGKKAYSPAFSTPEIFIASILIGLGAGLITGCIGAGGGFIIACIVGGNGIACSLKRCGDGRANTARPPGN